MLIPLLSFGRVLFFRNPPLFKGAEIQYCKCQHRRNEQDCLKREPTAVKQSVFEIPLAQKCSRDDERVPDNDADRTNAPGGPARFWKPGENGDPYHGIK